MPASAQAIPYFGRAWNISITPQNGASAVTLASAGSTPSLRVLFTIDTFMLMTFWAATVTIYNLGNSTASGIAAGSGLSLFGPSQNLTTSSPGLAVTDALSMGDVVTISAGYQSGNSGDFNPSANLLYGGNLLQSIGTRENVTDTKLILRCIANLPAIAFNFANFPRSKNASDWDILQQILNKTQLAVDNIDSASQQAMQNQKYSRGQAIFSRPLDAIDDIAKQHNIFAWVGSKGLNMRTFDPTAALTPDFVYGPPNLSTSPNGATPTTGTKTTVIGTPEQTQDGVIFRVLMDSQIQIGNIVQLAYGTAINGFQFPFGNLPPLPNATGTYIVAGLRHVGDTRGRGDDWYTEITAMTPQFFSTNVLVNTANSVSP